MTYALQQKIGLYIGLLLLISISSAHAEVRFNEYWMVSEFFERFPEQKQIAREFNLRVQGQAKDSVHNKEAINILVVYPGLQASDYWRRSVAAFEARLKKLSIHYQLDSQFTKPGTELNLQAKLIGKSLEDKPDYLIFTLDAVKHKKLIERVLSDGTTKVILQNITTPLKAFGARQPFLYVGFDHSVGTQLLIKQYKKLFPEGGNYAILFGTQGYVSKLRGGVFEAAMNRAQGFHLKDSYYVNFDRSMAAEATLELLKQFPDDSTESLDFIYAASTDIALGALDTLKAQNREQDIIVNGWGGGSAELESIRNNELDFTVMRMNDDNGVAMAEAIALDLQGNKAQVPTVYSGSFRLVDQSIDDDQLQRFESRAFRYSDVKR